MELPDLLAHPTFMGASLMQVRVLLLILVVVAYQLAQSVASWCLSLILQYRQCVGAGAMQSSTSANPCCGVAQTFLVPAELSTSLCCQRRLQELALLCTVQQSARLQPACTHLMLESTCDALGWVPAVTLARPHSSTICLVAHGLF